jgi:L-2-hydroxyglutarate oxidase LhgO
MDHVDCIVIGAGVVGLACARALALVGHEVLILDRENSFGTVTSARNSEVIHAGIYYPQNSLKAKLCVQGKAMLYGFLRDRGIPHEQCGKLIVATSKSQLQTLSQIQSRAADNGVVDLLMLNKHEASELEPELFCVGALLSPSTGILDSHAFMLSLLGEAENSGATLVCNTEVKAIELREDRLVLTTAGPDSLKLTANTIINSAGLNAPDLARRILSDAQIRPPTSYYAKGNYFSMQAKNPFSRLIYPVPEPGGLGIHLTLDLNGQARFGPDVQWVEHIDYTVDISRIDHFHRSIRRYWPGVDRATLQPDYAGIRPKTVGPDAEAADFVIEGPKQHGIKGLVNLFGIESPGLTASLAIAQYVTTLLPNTHSH